MTEDKDRIVAVGLLTQADLNLLGPTFARAYRIDDTPCFDDLLRAIDEADRDARTTRKAGLDASPGTIGRSGGDLV